MTMPSKKDFDEIVRMLVDEGRLIEAGFVGLRRIMPPDAPPVQVTEMRNAFFAGAQHLFGSIMQMLEPGAEATDKDMERLTLIATELDEFIEQYKKTHGIAGTKQ